MCVVLVQNNLIQNALLLKIFIYSDTVKSSNVKLRTKNYLWVLEFNYIISYIPIKSKVWEQAVRQGLSKPF